LCKIDESLLYSSASALVYIWSGVSARNTLSFMPAPNIIPLLRCNRPSRRLDRRLGYVEGLIRLTCANLVCLLMLVVHALFVCAA
jgi:hypothetical protein